MSNIIRVKSGAELASFSEILVQDGAIIVEDVFDNDLRIAIMEELGPYIDATKRGSDDFSGIETTRTGAIVARSPSTRRLITHPGILALANQLLLPNCEKIQLMLTQIIRLLPGQGAQPLHRDRFVWGPHVHFCEPQLNTIWALTDFTCENGATRIAPGSSKWDLERQPSDDELIQAEMRAGSVLIFTGNVLHGGGKNMSEEPRMGLNINYCLGWLRQEENQYLSCPPDIAKTLDPELFELLGYSMPNYALGYYSDPKLDISADAGVHPPQAALGFDTAQMGPTQNYLMKPGAAA